MLHIEWERKFSNYTSDKDLISRKYKEFIQLNNKTITQFLKWANNLNRQFSKNIYWWPAIYEKKAKIKNINQKRITN